MKNLFVFSSLILFSCGSAQKEKEPVSIGSEKKVEKEVTLQEETSSVGISTLSVDDFEKQIQSPCTVLDVRTPEEVAEGIIPNAIVININDADFSEKIKTIDSNLPVCVYCRSGKRSLKAAEMLAANGYTVYNLDGGIISWMDAGKTTSK